MEMDQLMGFELCGTKPEHSVLFFCWLCSATTLVQAVKHRGGSRVVSQPRKFGSHEASFLHCLEGV